MGYLVTDNGDFDFDTRFDVDGSDLLYNVARAVEIDDALVDAHFETIPGVGTFTTRRLTGGDLEGLGGEANGPTDLESLIFGARNDVIADLLQVLNVAASKSDANAVEAGGFSAFVSSFLL